MCLVFWWIFGSLANWMPTVLSHSILTGSSTLGMRLRSWRELLSHIASYVGRLHTTYSFSIVDRAKQSCFLLHYDMAPPPRMKRSPKVDLDSFGSPPQSTSKYPLNLYPTLIAQDQIGCNIKVAHDSLNSLPMSRSWFADKTHQNDRKANVKSCA